MLLLKGARKGHTHDSHFLLSAILRRVHTNPLKCTLDQIASNCFEPIHIGSVHTLVTESEFDYGLRKYFCRRVII